MNELSGETALAACHVDDPAAYVLATQVFGRRRHELLCDPPREQKVALISILDDVGVFAGGCVVLGHRDYPSHPGVDLPPCASLNGSLGVDPLCGPPNGGLPDVQPPFQLMRVSEPPPESSCARTSARFLFVATARFPSHGLVRLARARLRLAMVVYSAVR